MKVLNEEDIKVLLVEHKYVRGIFNLQEDLIKIIQEIENNKKNKDLLEKLNKIVNDMTLLINL